MPLIDDDTLRTDRKSRSWWPWVIVAAGFAFLWLIFALVVSFVPLAISGKTSVATPTAPMQSRQSDLIRQAQQMMSFGSPAQAVSTLTGINPAVPMTLSDKHTYFRVSAEALSATGSPLAASRFYDRFLTLGTSIRSSECASCHSPATQIAPLKVADLLRSDLGKSYVAALTAASQVKSTRASLQALLKKDPGNARAHLLLYHIAVAREETSAAEKHASAIRKLDDAADAKPAAQN